MGARRQGWKGTKRDGKGARREQYYKGTRERDWKEEKAGLKRDGAGQKRGKKDRETEREGERERERRRERERGREQ